MPEPKLKLNLNLTNKNKLFNNLQFLLKGSFLYNNKPDVPQGQTSPPTTTKHTYIHTPNVQPLCQRDLIFSGENLWVWHTAKGGEQANQREAGEPVLVYLGLKVSCL